MAARRAAHLAALGVFAAASHPAPPTPPSSCLRPMAKTAVGGRNSPASYLDPTHNVTRCCETCDRTPGCIGWTVNTHDNHCFIKAAVGAPIAAPGVTSGLHPGVKPAPPPTVTPEPPLPPSPPTPVTPCVGRCPNVLLIIADDMRPQLGCYGHDFVHTPNIDRLASEGTLFNRAYVQYAFCAPSRNSFMSGRRVDRTQVWNFMQNFRRNGRGADWTSLPQNFKRNGYLVMGTGKTFHPGDPFQFDYPHSWSFDEQAYTFGKLNDTGHPTWVNTTSDKMWCDNVSVVCADGEDGCPEYAKVDGEAMWCSVNVSAMRGRKLWDMEERDFAVAHLRRAASVRAANRLRGEAERPFFLGVGFHRPHLPWIAPSTFYDLYPNASGIAGPKHPNVPVGMPPVAWHSGGGNTITHPLPDDVTRRARRGLYATMSYVDSLVGDVLSELDALSLMSGTVTVLIGDHGQHVGEHNLWQKMTNFEQGVRIPMIIRAPWVEGSAGRRTNALAEVVDLFKTLSDLAGIPVPTGESHDVQGESLAPALSGGARAGALSNYSFSQFAKSGPDDKPFDTCMSCFPAGKSAPDFMGLSVRCDGWRYTEWYRWDKVRGRPAWGERFATELYDHRGDEGNDFDAWENVNLSANNTAPPAGTPEGDAVGELAPVLRAQFQHDE